MMGSTRQSFGEYHQGKFGGHSFSFFYSNLTVRRTPIWEYMNETGHFMDKRAGGIQIFFDAEKDAEAMPTM